MSPRPRTAVRTAVAWAVPAGLVALHLAPLRPAGTLGGGAVPAELAYRLAWTALATGYVVWFCARRWRVRDGEPPGPGDDPGGGAPGTGEVER